MEKRFKIFVRPAGFSLAEVLAALIIGSLVLVAVLGIYSRAENAATGVIQRLETTSLPKEVLQRIAEDLDRMAGTGSGVAINVENKIVNGLQTARLEISNTYYDKKNEKQTFEEIVWQGNYDYETGNGLILYRSYDGITVEDKLLEDRKESWEKGLFVPICAGVTFFKIEARRDGNLMDRWTSSTALPYGIVITLSFTEPAKNLDGTMDIPDAGKISRTISINKSREIKFVIVKKEEAEKSNL